MNHTLTGRLRAPCRLALAGMVAILMLFGPLAMSASADSSYKVQPGDTLISIAARYGTTVDAIVAANNLPSRSTIYAGQVLTIPSPGSNPAPQPRNTNAQPGQRTHTVQPGDSLSAIAIQYDTTTEAIMSANGLSSTTIYAGQTLVIPAAGSPAPSAPPPSQPQPQQQAAPGTYVVQPGDSIIGVANKFGVTQQALADANGLQPLDRLRIGQVLKIPGAGQIEPPAQPQQPPPAPALPTATSVPQVQPTTTPIPVQSGQDAERGKPVQYTVQSGDNLSTIAARFDTTVAAILELNNLSDRNFLRVGQVLTIVKGNDQNNDPPVKTATPEPAPPMGEFGPKWVDVNITTQTMVAFEGQTPVFTSKVSTGLARYPTVEGIYRVYAKYRVAKMEGGRGADYYYIPKVPYIMYFYSGYALHGADWHNNFGQPMSHGCVNLPVDAAKWMFDWAPVGTMVVTHK